MTIGKAPLQYEAIALAQEKIVGSLPLLGGGRRLTASAQVT
jgi:hypothetical protein